MNPINLSLFNATNQIIAEQIRNDQAIIVGKFVIDTIPEYKYAVLTSIFGFTIICAIIKYSASILGLIYHLFFKKDLIIPFPAWSWKKINLKNQEKDYIDLMNIGFYIDKVDLFAKIELYCSLLIEFRILYGIQYLIF